MRLNLIMRDAEQPDTSTRKDAIDALGDLFSDPRIHSHAHYRYRIDAPTEAEEALDTVFKEALGPNWNKKHQRWVRRLRRLGLIR